VTEHAEERSAKIEVNGEQYDFPLIDETITLDEERILYLYADCTIQDFLPSHPEWDEGAKIAHEIRRGERFRNPSLKRALVHIAVRRAHPERSDDEIDKALGALSALAVDVAVVEAVKYRPPAQTSQSEPESTTNTSEPSRDTPSGRHGSTDSATPDKSPADSGTTESDTSSPVALVAPLAS
jgi:hypothetical protein